MKVSQRTGTILSILTALFLAAGSGLLLYEPWAGPDKSGYIIVTDMPLVAASVAEVDVDFVYSNAISGFAAELTEDEAKALAAQPGVTVEPDIEFEAFDTVPTGVDRVDAEKYWAIGRGAGVTVAVLDTGIGPHGDLDVVASLSRDFTLSGSWEDGHGHGTHVAGIIAARENGAGVVGVAPDASLVALKVLGDSGRGNLSWIIGALDWAIAHRSEIDIINMSLGATIVDRSNCATAGAFHKAICNAVDAGIVVIVAAGNSNRDAEGTIPATYAEVLTVSALGDTDGKSGGLGPDTQRYGPDDTLAGFSNWGEDIDLAAPGVQILSAAKGGGVVSKSGTSMASPHVAGLAALYIEAHGKPINSVGVMAVHAGLKQGAAAQEGICGFTNDKDVYAEPLAMAVPCGEQEPTPGPTPTSTPTPQPSDPPTDLSMRVDCLGGEVNATISWQDNSPNESWFGVYITEPDGNQGVWRASVEPGTERFVWTRGAMGESRHVIVGAHIGGGYQWSSYLPFTIECLNGPQPTPTPAPECPDLDRLRELACEGMDILFPGIDACENE